MSQTITLPSSQQQYGNEEEQKHWLENVLPLIAGSRPMFSDSEDAEDVYGVEKDLKTRDEGKLRELNTIRDRLRTLSRQAESYKQSAQRPTNAPTEKQHDSKLAELDARRYGLVKTIADLEGAISSAEVQLARQKDEIGKVEREDPTTGNEEGMGAVIKLQLYRGMGFLPLEDHGTYNKLIITSGTDVHALATNGGLSDYEYASKAWGMLA